MSEQSNDPLNTNDELSGVTSWIDYEKTAEMRMSSAMQNIKQYSAMKDVDDAYAVKYNAWVAYYKTIKPLSDSADYESIFNVEIPQ